MPSNSDQSSIRNRSTVQSPGLSPWTRRSASRIATAPCQDHPRVRRCAFGYRARVPERRVIIDHLTIGVSDLERSRAFYAEALAPLGFEEIGPWSENRRDIAFGTKDADDF